MQLTSKFNNVLRFLFSLCVIDIFGKYAWVVSLKDITNITKGITITNAFQKILKESNRRKPKKYGLTKEANFTIILLKNG